MSWDHCTPGASFGGAGAAAGDVLQNAEDLGQQADTLKSKAGQFIAQVQRSSIEMLSAGEAAAVAKARD